MENAKSMLHQFMQINNIKADYKYSSVGQAHNKSFNAEMGVRELTYHCITYTITFSISL